MDMDALPDAQRMCQSTEGKVRAKCGMRLKLPLQHCIYRRA